jgi:hypothetical protein
VQASTAVMAAGLCRSSHLVQGEKDRWRSCHSVIVMHARAVPECCKQSSCQTSLKLASKEHAFCSPTQVHRHATFPRFRAHFETAYNNTLTSRLKRSPLTGRLKLT